MCIRDRRRSRRSLLRGMEQARRPAMADHVHRIASMGARVLINGTWYNLLRKWHLLTSLRWLEDHYLGHGRGHRFDPCRAHHLSRIIAALFVCFRIEYLSRSA